MQVFRQQVSVCKCCGQTLPDPMPHGLNEISLSKKERRILKRVIVAGKYGVDSESLFEHLYGDDPNGGPMSAKNILSVYVRGINKKIVTTKMQIKGGRRGNDRAIYRFVQAE